MEFTTKSAEGTQKAGGKFARKLSGGETLALTGELGSGKTTFVQGLTRGLGIKRRIISPTFIIMRRYDIKLKTQNSNVKTITKNSKLKNFYHIDLYRLERNLENEVSNLGLDEVWGKADNIVAIEWAEKIKNLLPRNAIWIKFQLLNDDKRKVIISRPAQWKPLKNFFSLP